ncbi:hypothetical protein F5Y12DRAFT_799407 [Xylaria sp. FL1777]|nr:hypothetical protein F5Y12DRAFT_799407 [Xylaria sp. FL1777]
MEAIAAAGALPGLASATIQLGTATFQFYQQLHSLYKAIKHGENDLNTAVRRLDQHEDFIKELRFNFERTSDANVPAGTRDLFERHITDSEAEVKEFRCLLDRIGKHHFKRKSWHAVETGTRLRIHEHSIQKYCDLLDKQMQRFLFLQSSVQSMRVESTLSEVLETLVKQGTKAVAFYDEQSSLRKIDRELRSPLGAASKETHLSSKGIAKCSRTTSSLPQDVIPKNWVIKKTKSYPTLCGTFTVMTYREPMISIRQGHQFAYKVWFEPYSWISRTLVEWRCLIGSAHTPPTMMLSVITSIICDDPDVLDALGFVASKVPNYRKVRVLLDTGRLLKDHVLVGNNPEDIITAYLGFHRFGQRDEYSKPVYDSNSNYIESNLDYLAEHYLEYYSVIELLLAYGFEPHLSNWQQIYALAVQNHHHILTNHRRWPNALNLTFKSVPSLILEVCGYCIPLNCGLTCEEILWITIPMLQPTGAIMTGRYEFYHPRSCSVSHFAHLMALVNPAEKIKETLNLGPLDLADEEYMFDRWLLGLFAPFRPEIASLVEEYITSYQTITARNSFNVTYIREEFKQPPRRSNVIQRQDFLKFASFYGNAAIIQQLDIASLTRFEIEGMQIYAAQSSNQEIFDVLMSYRPRMPAQLPHTRLMSDRLANDPAFLDYFLGYLEADGKVPLSVFLRDIITREFLILPTSYPLPDYIRNLIICQIQRYERYPLVTGQEMYLMIYKITVNFWANEPPAEYFLQDLHLYTVLRLLAQMPAFKSLLDTPGLRNSCLPLDFIESTYPEGYSALMFALHCGLKPVVRILVDAGASILKPMPCGKSALSVARENIRAQHPRPRAMIRHPTSRAIMPDWHGSAAGTGRISESTDKDMLEILLEALRDRGEVETEMSDDGPIPSRWRIFKGKACHFARWLFQPYIFNADTFRDNSIYAVLVSTLWFLLVLKVLKLELSDYLSKVINLLSRPVVIIALVGWILWHLR